MTGGTGGTRGGFLGCMIGGVVESGSERGSKIGCWTVLEGGTSGSWKGNVASSKITFREM